MTVPDESGWSRRGFLRAAAGTTMLAAASGTTTAQTDPVTVELGPGGEFKFSPGTEAPLEIEPGTTVRFVWRTSAHNIVVESQPEGANWQGHDSIEEQGYEFEFTFEVEGEYNFYCQPHQAAGMKGTIIVGSTGGATTTETTETTPESDGDGESSGGGDGSGGGTAEVAVGPGGEFVFTPGTDEPLQIDPGTTVTWVWESDTHNIVVDGQPDGANWEGHETIENTGFEYEHTFDVEGEYHYFCQPHLSLGMEADIIVGEGGSSGGDGGSGGGGPGGRGVPAWAETLGIATFGTMSVVLGLAYFFIKFGGDYDVDR